jgi:hypothetical protein
VKLQDRDYSTGDIGSISMVFACEGGFGVVD